MTVATASIRQLEESRAELQSEIDRLQTPLGGTSPGAVLAEAKRLSEARNAIPALRTQIEYLDDEIARLERAETQRQKEAAEVASVRRLAEASAKVENRARRFNELVAEAEAELKEMQAIADEVQRDGRVFELAPSVATLAWIKKSCTYFPSVERSGEKFLLMYTEKKL